MYKKTLDHLKANIQPWVAKNPKNNLWYGIDKICRWPTTKGFKTKAQAIEAWYVFETTARLSIAHNNLDV